jgi:hypothetical protein
VAIIGQSNAYRIFVGKHPLGRPRNRWDDHIKLDLREIGCEDGRLLKLSIGGFWY